MQGGGSSSNAGNRIPNTDAVSEENSNPQQPFRPNPDRYVPINAVIRIMRRGLPPQAKIADDAKEIVQACVTEFISFITNEANQKCRRECRKTIGADDIISAMRSLGFDNYIEPLTAYLTNYRAQDQVHNVVQHRASFARQNTDFVQQMMTQMGWNEPPPPLPLPSPTAHSYTMDGGDGVDLSQTGDNYFMGNQDRGRNSSMGM